MDAERKLQIMQALVVFARPEILKEFRADSCIASTRIGMDVLDYFGILSEPLPVRVMIWNPAFVQHIEAGRNPENTAELDILCKEGAWNVGLGYGGDMEPNKWPGHLVLIGERRWLMDLSLDQANRPQHNIYLKPIGLEIGGEFLTGKEPRILVLKNGCVLRFVAVPENIGYTNSPNWLFERQRASVVKTIIAQIQKEIK